MEKIGKVISTSGNIAKLEIRRASACGEKCGSCSGGCSSTGTFIEVENPLNAKPGQFVKIEVETKVVMKAAFIAYVFPLFMLISGIILGSYIHKTFHINISSEVFSLLTGIVLMSISYGIVKIIDKNYDSNKYIEKRITKIL
ncbi:SoxR reducing system RseC family protein [Wukongibacter baidiensis]|uniref:SoxR reducing system RseC family protein n=1 Tax=Wukongibacter baidiensis TaxID=1723361 RepID=UPI003D7FECA4